MAKINLEPGKTTWVPFLAGKARFQIERVCKIHYRYDYDLLNDEVEHPTRVRYRITGLGADFATPPSKVTVKFQGIPVLVTSSDPTTDKDRFDTEWVDEPFVIVKDRAAKREKGEVEEKQLGKRLIERTWTEKVERTLTVENETGKAVRLELKVYDAPGRDIVLLATDPGPDERAPPEHVWWLELEKDEKKQVELQLEFQQKEQIELPPDEEEPRPPPPPRPRAQLEQVSIPNLADDFWGEEQAAEEAVWLDEEEEWEEEEEDEEWDLD